MPCLYKKGTYSYLRIKLKNIANPFHQVFTTINVVRCTHSRDPDAFQDFEVLFVQIFHFLSKAYQKQIERFSVYIFMFL